MQGFKKCSNDNSGNNTSNSLQCNKAIEGNENHVSMLATSPNDPEMCSSNYSNTVAQLPLVVNDKAFFSYSSLLPHFSNLNCTSALSSNGTRASGVTVSIDYPSKTVNKALKKEYESVGKALDYGPAQRVAKAVFKCKPLVKLIIKNVFCLISSEVSGLCSRKNPSLMHNNNENKKMTLSISTCNLFVT